MHCFSVMACSFTPLSRMAGSASPGRATALRPAAPRRARRLLEKGRSVTPTDAGVSAGSQVMSP
jgi:hypothetical protein